MKPNPQTPVKRKPLFLRWYVVITICLLIGTVAVVLSSTWQRAPTPPAGMVWIPGGEFIMGSPEGYPPQERPRHRVSISGFFMDIHEVTNADFGQFVDATGYKTLAEKTPDWTEMQKTLPPGAPKPPDNQLVPGSLVFQPTTGPVPLGDPSYWWHWTPGAYWRQPEGPGSTIVGRENHPVVHIAWEDAVAYCQWAGKRLPTEAEWEYAARGGENGKRFIWGNEAPTDTDGSKANIWQGPFPYGNTRVDGYERTATVGMFPANNFGLHDMAGNVWEWCSDWYHVEAYRGRSEVIKDPTGPEGSFDPAEIWTKKRVIRGGSFLCHVTYCESYRPGARRGTAIDTSLCHLGFRCVVDGPSSRR